MARPGRFVAGDPSCRGSSLIVWSSLLVRANARQQLARGASVHRVIDC
jgi:hypothetical protein